MKKLNLLFTALLLMCCVGTAKAEKVTIDGITYDVITKTKQATVISRYTKYSGDIVIPSKITYNNVTCSVTSIGELAFYDCSGLTSITIGNSVTSIGNQAFCRCHGLTSITIPNSVTSIGNYAFEYCSRLTSITVATDNAKYDSRDNSNAIIETTTNTLVVGCKNTIIPNSVTSIGYEAFEGCSSLTSVVIPNSVTSIGSSAFSGCTGLTSVVIPNSVTSIGAGAFYNCSGLTSVTIGNSVTSIGNYAFYDCTGLKTVYNYSNLTFTKGSTDYGSVARYADKLYNAPNGSVEGDYIFGKPNGANTLVVYLGNDTELTLPADYKGKSYVIGANAFYGNKTLTSIVIPNNVTSIGEDAFYKCTGLKTVYNYSNLTFTKGSTDYGCVAYYADKVYNVANASVEGDYIFNRSNDVNTLLYYWGNDTELTLPADYKGEDYVIGADAFCGNTALTSVVIPNSVTSIGNYAFDGCTGLRSVVIPDGVTSIGNYAFRGCTGLTSITIPNSVTSIGYNAFYNCTGLTSITIPNSVTSIGYNAFYNCSGLTSVVIPNSVTSIESSAFSGCTGLTSVVIPNSVTGIGSSAFKGCSGLTSVVIPNSVTSIEDYAFNGCTSLKDLRIEDGTKTLSLGDNYYNGSGIGQGLFYDCPLETLYLGRNLSYNIGSKTGYSPFYGKTTLTSVTIGNSVTSIGERAFDGCTGLRSVVIPDGVTSIGNYAFRGCTGLKEVHINDLAAWCSIDFGDAYANPLYYAKNLYLNGEKVTDLVIPNGVTSIGERAFYSCSGLTSITIPNSVTSIGESAFCWCSGLTSITIPNSVTSIGNSAFSHCTGLTSITIPNSVTSIGNSAFSDCSGLTSITIPNSVTSIGERAFYSCSRLTSITIGNSVTSIGNYAFYDCTGLKTVYNFSILTFTKGSTDYGYVAYYADKVYNTFVVPEERKYYKIKNVATGLYLQVSGNNTNMTLQEKSDAKLQIFTLEDAGEGKFYIKSTDADNCYYAHATTWNFNATTNANNKTPFTIALLDGETNIYTLYQNVTNNVGFAGTDSSNAGAFVFCDKRAENNGKWAFEVFTDEVRIAAAMATLENAIANAKSVLETRAQLLTNDEKQAISADVQTAKDEKGNTNADVTAEIARLTALSEMVNNAVGDAIYVNAIDEISNAVCYTVSTESRGAWYSEASNLNSTGKLNIAYNITDNKQQFAFIKSPKTGKYYLYSVSEAKFVSKNGDYTTLTETPVQTITFLTGERTASYPWIIALNTADGEKQIAVSNTFEYGIITFYNDLTDAGNTVRLEKVATFDATAALALIDAYENGETAIEEVNVENVNVIIYDLQGRRVKEITEGGIYIINGKKLLVK